MSNRIGQAVNAIRKALAEAYPETDFNAPFHVPARNLIAFAAAVARHESGFGEWWVNRRVYDWLSNHGYTDASFDEWAEVVRNGNNWGAIQHYDTPDTKPWPLISPDGGGFLYHDSKPVQGEGNVPYPIYFRKYDSADQGARDLIKILYLNRPTVFDAAAMGDYYKFSAEMRRTVYYEGRGDTRAEQIEGHRKAIFGHLTVICRAMGWSLPGGQDPSPPLLRLWDTGPDVLRAEERLVAHGYLKGAQPDKTFDLATDAAVRLFQADKGLQVDGIIGAGETWPALLAEAKESPDRNPKTHLVEIAELASKIQQAAKQLKDMV